MDEFAYINHYLTKIAVKDALRNDGYVLNENLVITKDIIVEKIHFLSTCTPCILAKKALRVNLSDIAAMGAHPYGYFLGLVLPKDVTPQWWREFTYSLQEEHKLFDIVLLGGDTTAHAGPIVLSITMFGIKNKAVITRAKAQPNDLVFVSGTIGDAFLGLMLYTKKLHHDSNKIRDFLQQRYDLPIPRLALGEKISTIASAGIDVSDGLLQDLMHICMQSGVGMEIYLQDVPISKPAQQMIMHNSLTVSDLLVGGDDYELAFTTDAKNASLLEKEEVTVIGRVVTGTEVILLDHNRQRVTFKKGFRHFT